MQTTTQTAKSSQLKAGMAVVVAVAETIRELGQAPAGPIYAALMAKGIDYQAFEKILSILTGSGVVERRGDILVWKGPILEACKHAHVGTTSNPLAYECMDCGCAVKRS